MDSLRYVTADRNKWQRRAEKAEMALVVLRARGHDLYLAEQKRAEKAEAAYALREESFANCHRTVENLRQRAEKAEAEAERLTHGVLRDDEPTRCTAGHIRMINEEWEEAMQRAEEAEAGMAQGNAQIQRQHDMLRAERALADQLAEVLRCSPDFPNSDEEYAALAAWREARRG